MIVFIRFPQERIMEIKCTSVKIYDDNVILEGTSIGQQVFALSEIRFLEIN